MLNLKRNLKILLTLRTTSLAISCWDRSVFHYFQSFNLSLLKFELKNFTTNFLDLNFFKLNVFLIFKIICFQIALNGPLLKTRHKTEIEVFLMHIRRCLIELDGLSSKTKAFLLMILDLHYSNFNYALLENCLEKVYKKYLPDSASHENKVQKREEPPKVTIKNVHENGSRTQPVPSTSKKTHVKNERRSESYRSVPPRSPTKTSPPSRKSEPPSYQPPSYHRTPQQPPRSPQQQKSSPPKKISPRDLRNRVKSERGSSAPPVSPKAIGKVEKDFDKLNIEAARQKPTQKSPEQLKIQSNVEENILRQQNSSENSSPSGTLKQKPVTNASKVYFKEENAENLSWNGETSFEDDPETTIESPRVSQYSSSFLNFLSNN